MILRAKGKETARHGDKLPPQEVVAVDTLSLVRFGLRDGNDPRILNTVQVIDALLKYDSPSGPVWRRYTGDEFGEHVDGRPFRTTDKGIGRPWPLLIGERAHYELCRGKRDAAENLCAQMATFANETGLISEQIWDADDIPERDLERGKPTGSVCPLLWAHGEYVKLVRSLHDGRPFDLPQQTFNRYVRPRK